MILLALLLALGAERLMSTRRDGGSVDSPLVRLWQLLPKPLRDAPFATWLLAFALAGLVALIGSSLSGGLTQLVYATAALFVCLGPRDLADDVQRLRAARAAGDAATVARLTRSLQRGPAPDADHRSLLGALFIQSHERRFGACLWFIVGGPAGAVLYRIASRLSALVETPSAQRSAALLHNLLAWLPARLTALLFGLAGSMDDALDALKRVQREAQTAGSDGWQPRTWSLLAEAANASLDWEDAPGSGPMIASSLDATLAEVLRMETRATLILLALVALFTAGVWVA
ncbi:regulatory signaling modulator protein AmpE [Nevskia sp.]|uniref:regulatory signaling modulator protein AmpE n=1 Tax=Nevskia sp. TaxID=1929292 RepID=UPI0025F39D77|nr:regulatory signaling modulator protein AmpE [Nevskia sp.]